MGRFIGKANTVAQPQRRITVEEAKNTLLEHIRMRFGMAPPHTEIIVESYYGRKKCYYTVKCTAAQYEEIVDIYEEIKETTGNMEDEVDAIFEVLEPKTIMSAWLDDRIGAAMEACFPHSEDTEQRNVAIYDDTLRVWYYTIQRIPGETFKLHRYFKDSVAASANEQQT